MNVTSRPRGGHGSPPTRLIAGLLALSSGLAAVPPGVARAIEPGSLGAASTPLPASAPSGPQRTASPATDAREQAREHYRRGLAHHDAGARELALREFQRAHALSRQPQLLFAIGQVHYELGHLALARQSLERYLDEGGRHINDARRAAVARQLDELRRQTAVVALALDGSPTELEVQGRRVEASGTLVEVVVDTGSVPVLARRPGYPSLRRQLRAEAGGRIELPVVFERPALSPLAAPPRLYELIAWAGAGALALGAVGAGAATYRSHREYDRLRQQPSAASAESARARLDEQRDRVGDLALLTDSLALGALAVAGFALYTSLSGAPPSAPPTLGQLTAAGEF